MKKLFSIILLFVCTASFAQSTSPRFGTTAASDNTGRVVTYGVLSPVFASTLSITPKYSQTYFTPGTLTGAVTVNAVVTKAYKGDVLIVIVLADTSNRVLTFGTNFVTNSTVTCVASKKATVEFVFDGVKYIEVSRFIQS